MSTQQSHKNRYLTKMNLSTHFCKIPIALCSPTLRKIVPNIKLQSRANTMHAIVRQKEKRFKQHL
jgi:hypothetical protein